MNVLSLFDGISCGQVALQRAGIEVDNYFASEIDKYAIQVTQKNFPNTVQLGDIRDITIAELPKIDLLMGGSPCQGFSFAGKQLNFQDPRSKLFFEFVRILDECEPEYFLLENVSMKKEYQQIITNHLGVEPIMINSSLVSAQNRKRLYWTNIPGITQPEDKGIYLKDVLESDSITEKDKSYCIDANYFKGTNLEQYIKKSRRQIVFNHSSSGRGSKKVEDRFYEALSKKAHTLTATGYSKRSFTGIAGFDKEELFYRKLTPIECERLQTLPDNYTEGVSDTQRYKTLGNGWTVDVIVHILKDITGK